ncbi:MULTISPECIES: ABC transporter substrate-binding protein [Heyndrickxia]|jgi:raffinose/stachyose/melibiose transport system substrate-binding protein|uniref:ABC transporter substrate-binding protein n=1 Tax=Heyndrickxia TaxID=2837504 RepID=UPI0003A245C8|nr:extracellular solute-binding protein [Heyndrickxia oleronia]MCI1591716.1 extracellular solute-binding protein [Heyndrickxia oleronia]MCI1612890.1 extracellular solute-binding protein [Heyndrickxia oleronia]MCI1744116.1 extracellular solute-binding protein [Heyndrickxia oleronia]MCI1761601.1 extracellular solute-binding protein [Heyndrickxia oleronia]MCM3456456.1 extracellular solute-binding protein [Heyndrickxia oleronia]
MKRCLIYFITILFVSSIFLAGCSSSSSDSEKKVNKVELTIYSWRPEDKAAYEKFIDEFEKENRGVEVKFKPFKSTEYGTILTNALSSGKGPDIIQLRPYQGATTIADSGYLLPLDNVKGLTDIPKEYLDAAKGSDGKVYGVPLTLNSAVIFYNTQLFKENGLEPPKTWDQLLQVSKEFQSKDIVPIAQSGKASYLLSLTHSVIGATTYDGNQFVEEFLTGEVNLHDPRFVESIKRMKELEPFFPKDFVAIEDKDAQALFYTGKAAMYINGDYRLESFEQNNPDLPIDILPSVANTEGGDTPSVTWVDGSYGVVKASKHQKEALKFMEFLASKKFGQMFSDELNRMSAIPGVTPKHPLVKKLTEMSEKSNTPYFMLVHLGDGSPTTKTTFENALQGMYIDKLTADDVIEETQKSLDKWFKKQ